MMNRGGPPPPAAPGPPAASSSSGATSGAPSGSAAPGGSGQGQAAAAEQREQKLLDSATENLLTRMAEIKASIGGLIAKLENDPHLNWPSFLDSYALISGQLNSMVKSVKSEQRTPAFKKYICLPLTLAQERDEDLLKATEGRISHFSHDLVPDYLRTKPDPEVEAKHAQYEARVAALNPDVLNKQLTVMDKVTKDLLKHITKEKDDIESRATARAEIERTASIEDTFALVAAVSNGKGIRPPSSHPQMAPGMGPGGAAMMRPQQQPGGGAPPPGGKTGSAIKTNIRAASQVHPYGRP